MPRCSRVTRISANEPQKGPPLAAALRAGTAARCGCDADGCTVSWQPVEIFSVMLSIHLIMSRKRGIFRQSHDSGGVRGRKTNPGSGAPEAARTGEKYASVAGDFKVRARVILRNRQRRAVSFAGIGIVNVSV